MREGARETWGPLALLDDGTALRGGTALEGRWASVQPGAFLDGSGQELLVMGGAGGTWRLTLPVKARAVRVATIGERVATYPARLPLSQLDFVYSRGLKPVGVEVPKGRIWWRMSDHLPLIAEFKL